MERSEEVLSHWFGEAAGDGWQVAPDRVALWFRGGAEVDEELRRRFAADVDAARAGKLSGWASTPRGRLALLLLLDQLPRNLFRGRPEAFASDAMALSLSREALARGEDAQLRPIERTFLYLPFEHAEDRGAQATSVERFRALAQAAPASAHAAYEGFLDYAIRHQVIVERFGRFPHRNRILGRASTEEEEAFLREPGSSF
jgi:uncharacterized protein (DUF924 family)